MLNFIIKSPSTQTLRHHFNPAQDRTISRLLRELRPILKDGWDLYEYVENRPFLDVDECDVEQLVEDWIADHLWGGGHIDIDPTGMAAQLDSLTSVGPVPNLDALLAIYLWAWWREHTLLALLRNQRRGQPLGENPLLPGEIAQRLRAPAMPLHILSGSLPSACPVELMDKLDTLVKRVRADIENPTWVLQDAAQLRSAIADHYYKWVSFLLGAKVRISFNTASLAEASHALSQPMAPLPDYVGPRYKYGVDFRAGSFLIAQALALEPHLSYYHH